VIVGLLGFASADAPAVKGRIPDEAFGPAGVKLSSVPDYIVAYDRQGEVAGYVAKIELFDDKGARRPDRRLTVWDEALKRPVGAMVPDRGFVPVGARDESVPKFVVESHVDDP